MIRYATRGSPGYGQRAAIVVKAWRGPNPQDGGPGWFLQVPWSAKERVDRLRRLVQEERRKLGVQVPLMEWVPEERAWWVDEHLMYLVREVFPDFREEEAR